MNIKGLTLGFEIFHSTNLGLKIVHERIILYLQENNYRIIKQDFEHVSFDSLNKTALVQRTYFTFELESGIWKLYDTEIKSVKLTYYISLEKYFLLLIGIIIATCLFNTFLILCFIVPLLIGTVTDVIGKRNKATELLDEITKENRSS